VTHDRRATIDVMADLLELDARDVVDVGCGDGALVRRFAGLGARVTGVEVDPAVVAAAQAREPVAGERYVQGTGQDLGLPDDSADVVVFMQSLHHVPPARMDDALAEAARVVRPGGAVYVQEPLPEGEFFELVKLVDDETEVRALAQQALARASAAGLQCDRELRFDVPVTLQSFDAVRARVVGADPSRAARFMELEPQLRERYGVLAAPDGSASVTIPSVATLLYRR
jgi:SAM-dependent methyltransferase